MFQLRLLIFTLLLLPGALTQAETEAPLIVAGSASLVAPFTGAVPLLKQQGITLKVVSDSTSTAAIAGVGDKLCDFALSTRPVLPAERAAYPDKPLTETVIGYQALALIVSNDVWESGVRSLSRKEIIGIYEGKITEWKKLGGPDRKIKFFNPERGRGPWEFFVGWLYGEARKAPVGSQFETVATPEETANLVEFNGGSLAVLPPNHADGKGTHMIALRLDDGSLAFPTSDTVRKQHYPLERPVIVVTAFRPSGVYKTAIDFMLSAQGQELVRKADIVPFADEAAE